MGSSVNGSMRAESGSGMSSMSDAWMPFQPAIDEPSNACPSVNLLSSECLGGNRHVLLLAPRVREAEVDELDFVVLDHFHDVSAACHSFLLSDL